MARRKKKQEEHENLERWLVSYADFMTLLFAFFVVMYSISAVNEGKYRILSDSLSDTFSTNKPSSEIVIEFENSFNKKQINQSENYIELPIPNDSIDKQEAKNPSIAQIADQIKDGASEMIEAGVLNLNQSDNWLEIEINSNVLFESGGAILSEDAEDILAELATIIKAYPNHIQVEGYTDNIPIKTQRFPSNWELSSSRAASVVHLFEEEGVNPNVMQAIGFGKYRAKQSNDTKSGRLANRRVKIVVLGSSNKHKLLKSDSKNLKKLKDMEYQPQNYDVEPKKLIEF